MEECMDGDTGTMAHMTHVIEGFKMAVEKESEGMFHGSL